MIPEGYQLRLVNGFYETVPLEEEDAVKKETIDAYTPEDSGSKTDENTESPRVTFYREEKKKVGRPPSKKYS